MAEMDFGRGAQALCALHPELAASRTCTRCGNFMCDTCSEGGTQPRCPTCRERAGLEHAFPLHRANWTISTLLESCWAVFKREWVLLSVAVLIVFAASIAGQIASQVLAIIGAVANSVTVTVVFAIAGYIISSVIQGLVTLGFYRMLFDVLNGRPADLGRLFSQFGKTVPYLLTMLLITLMFVPAALLLLGAVVGVAGATGALSGLDPSQLEASDMERIIEALGASGLGLMAAVVVPLYLVLAIWFGLPLLLVQPEVAWRDEPRPMDTLRRCFAYARGQRLPILGVSLLGFVIVMVGFIACCVGVIPAVGLFQLLLAGLYLALSHGAEEG